jgi:Protein of unknwon function (DUF3310)
MKKCATSNCSNQLGHDGTGIKFCEWCLTADRRRAGAIKPAHYQGNGMQAIDVIEAFKLGYNLGNVVKYVLRAGHKGERNEDLDKAINYLWRERHATWQP